MHRRWFAATRMTRSVRTGTLETPNLRIRAETPTSTTKTLDSYRHQPKVDPNFGENPKGELRRTLLPKLFGNSEWVLNRGSESGQEGSKGVPIGRSWRQRSAVETPSAIFQTVSPRTRANKDKRGAEAA